MECISEGLFIDPSWLRHAQPQASTISILKKETLYWLHVEELFTYLKHFWNCEVKSPVYELLISVAKWKENSICCDWSQFIDLLCEFFIKVKFLNKKRNLLFNSWRRPLSYRNQSSDLQRKWMDWFLYDNGLRHERVKVETYPCSHYVNTIHNIWSACLFT